MSANGRSEWGLKWRADFLSYSAYSPRVARLDRLNYVQREACGMVTSGEPVD